VAFGQALLNQFADSILQTEEAHVDLLHLECLETDLWTEVLNPNYRLGLYLRFRLDRDANLLKTLEGVV
jgi:hypothetical protein